MKYKIKSIEISNFWYRYKASCDFDEEVNIIIGKNGTGKTTFMNILHAVLAVDLEALAESEFDETKIVLSIKGKSKTIRAEKSDDSGVPFTLINYFISGKKYRLRIFPSENRLPTSYRRREMQDAEVIRESLEEYVSLSSLSVYRIRGYRDLEVRDRHGLHLLAPVDYRLMELKKELTRYQLELSQQARKIATSLQKDVLTSILYRKQSRRERATNVEFDKNLEEQNLIAAFTQLGILDSDVKKRIKDHVSSISVAYKAIQSTNNIELEKIDDFTEHFEAMDAYSRTQNIIKMSLGAEIESDEVFSQVNEFLKLVQEFIEDKELSFEEGDLKIRNEQGEISVNRLSSGEKQLLILFIETLLQKQQVFVYLADEPEISLHIAWQQKIIPAIKTLNPNAQIIAATHSPEIASSFPSCVIDMEEIVSG